MLSMLILQPDKAPVRLGMTQVLKYPQLVKKDKAPVQVWKKAPQRMGMVEQTAARKQNLLLLMV